MAANIPNLPLSAQACARPNPDAVFGLARSFIYSPEDTTAFDIIVDNALQAIQDSKVDAEMDVPPSAHVPDVTPVVHTISSEDELLAPQQLDYEGASGVITPTTAGPTTAVIGRRLFGKQSFEQVRPPRSRSRSPGSDQPPFLAPPSSGSSISADSRKMLTKNQKKKIRDKASKVRKTNSQKLHVDVLN